MLNLPQLRLGLLQNTLALVCTVLYTHLHLLSGADDFSAQQLITAICDVGDGLTLCEQLS
jgi:hypothetical protein